MKCTFRDFVAILERNGFVEVRQSGSHRRFRAERAGKVWLVTVAYHAIGDEIGQYVLASMIRQSGLDKDQFRK
ncbi:MAG: type II toxin-antitoxin system HicA family toxin [Alphaproteobacteria bacterium]|nr:type II toxin-antitoxin system HicA family toxin [Alphaproteobacteria bacterium]